MSAPNVYVFCASDSLPHQPAVSEILASLAGRECIASFIYFNKPESYEAAFGKIQTGDLALLLLSNGFVSLQSQIESQLKELHAKKSGLKLAEILIDNVPYDDSFTLLPSDLVPIAGRNDPSSAWLSIQKKLEEWFPKVEKRKSGFVKYLVAGLVLVALAIFLWPSPVETMPPPPPDTPPAEAKPVLEKLGEFTYGGDGEESVVSIAPTADGGALLAGSSTSQPTNGNSDFRIVRIDVDGNILWEKNYGGLYDEFLTTAITLPDGFLLGGLSYSANDGNKDSKNYGRCDFWIVKIDHSGRKLWDQSYGGDNYDIIEDIVPVGDGYLLGGYSSSLPGEMKDSRSQGSDFWLVKTNLEGVKMWDKNYGGKGQEFINDISLEPDMDVLLLAGYSNSARQSGFKETEGFGNDDFWAVLTDLSGNKLGESSIGGLETEKAFASAYIKSPWIGGESNSKGSTGNMDSAKAINHGQSDFYLAKMDVKGKKLWDRTYGGSDFDVMMGMLPVKDGMLLAGHSASGKSGTKTSSNQGQKDGWLVSVDANGQQILDETFGGAGNDVFYTIARLKDGSYLVAGSSDSPAGQNKTSPALGKNDFWVVKVRMN
jgi:hypothetical protein